MHRKVAAVLLGLCGLLLILGGSGKLESLDWLKWPLPGLWSPQIVIDADVEEKFARDLIGRYKDAKDIPGLASTFRGSLSKVADIADKTPSDSPEDILALFRQLGKEDMGEAGWQSFVPVSSDFNQRVKELHDGKFLPNCANVAALFRAWAKGLAKS